MGTGNPWSLLGKSSVRQPGDHGVFSTLMLSKKLESTLNTAFSNARGQRHELLTVEHLLLALLDDEGIQEMFADFDVQVVALKDELESHIDAHVPKLDGWDRDTQPTLSFQRILQRSVFHVQSSRGREVTSFNTLIGLFSEGESEAVAMLNRHDISRARVIEHIKNHSASEPIDEALAAAEADQTGINTSTSQLDRLEANVSQMRQEIGDLTDKVQRLLDRWDPEK